MYVTCYCSSTDTFKWLIRLRETALMWLRQYPISDMQNVLFEDAFVERKLLRSLELMRKGGTWMLSILITFQFYELKDKAPNDNIPDLHLNVIHFLTDWKNFQGAKANFYIHSLQQKVRKQSPTNLLTSGSFHRKVLKRLENPSVKLEEGKFSCVLYDFRPFWNYFVHPALAEKILMNLTPL